jgi:hypothetical protein
LPSPAEQVLQLHFGGIEYRLLGIRYVDSPQTAQGSESLITDITEVAARGMHGVRFKQRESFRAAHTVDHGKARIAEADGKPVGDRCLHLDAEPADELKSQSTVISIVQGPRFSVIWVFW